MEFIDYVTVIAFIAAVIAITWYGIDSARERERVLVAVDVSGSAELGQDPVASIDDIAAQLTRRHRELVWVAFNHEIREFTPGEHLGIFGGTNFALVKSWAEDPANGGFDRIVVISDGIALPIEPAEPTKWEWWTNGPAPQWITASDMVHRQLRAAARHPVAV